jgi:hypothetical protein
MKLNLILLLVLITILFINLKKGLETFENKTTIAFIIPTTSNKRDYKNILQTDFFNILLKSIRKTQLNNKFNYKFYLGYDHDDDFFYRNDELLKKEFNSLNLPNSTIKTIKIYNKKGKLGEIWSELAEIASKECDYIYQLGDDIEILTSEWEETFIEKLKESNNIGVVGPLDRNNKNILTQSFVHKTHLDIFGEYYPKEIKNWHIDDWITRVYQPNLSNKILNKQVKNSGGPPRYEVKRSDKELKECLKRDINTLRKYLRNNIKS